MLAILLPSDELPRSGMREELFNEVPESQPAENAMDEASGTRFVTCVCEVPGRVSRHYSLRSLRYVINALCFYSGFRGTDLGPVGFLAGHSLGEYNALLAVGVFDLITGLRLVKKRGELITSARSGSMAAVIGLEPERITELLQLSELATLDVANYNSASQTIVSGPASDIRRAGLILRAAGTRMYLKLPVGASLNSRYMTEVADRYAQFLEQFTFTRPQRLVTFSVTALPHPTECPAAIKSLLGQQLIQPVQWMQAFRYLMDSGATRFQEVGSGGTLTCLLQQIQH